MKKKLFLTLLCVLALGMMLLIAGCGSSEEADSDAAPASDGVKATCENGVMVGQTTDGVTSFKGVPYAKPPVDDLRWRAPQAPDPSSDEIECLDFGYTALQYEWPTEPASSFPKNEDCLTLNIWENESIMDSEEAKPVMVFSTAALTDGAVPPILCMMDRVSRRLTMM